MTIPPITPSHTLLRLESARCCALIEWEVGRIPVWRHFGKLLAQTPLAAHWPAAALRRQANASMDRLDGNPVFPGFGNGLALNPALRVHCDGTAAVQEWLAASFTQSASAAAQSLVLHLQDASGLALDLHLTLWHDSDVLSLHSTLHNHSARTVQLDWQACGCVQVAADVSDVAHFFWPVGP